MAIITHLIVEERGAYVSKHQGRLQVKKGKEVLQQAPLMHLEQVLISGKGISFSTDAVAACAEEGIPIHFVAFNGQPYASLYAAGLTQTVQTRRAQLLAYNESRAVELAISLAEGKIKNQAALLRYRAKYLKETAPNTFEAARLLALEVLDHLAELETLSEKYPVIDRLRVPLLNIEARAAKKYWAGVRQVVPQMEEWPGRRGQGASDPLNAALNYGYGILYGQVQRALILAGLDPYAGFIHTDRPGKPSLVFDLIEVFRQPVVDRAVFATFGRGAVFQLDEKNLLSAADRKGLATAVLNRLEKPEKYNGQRVPLRIIIQNQARALATYLRRDRASFEPFTVRW